MRRDSEVGQIPHIALRAPFHKKTQQNCRDVLSKTILELVKIFCKLDVFVETNSC